MSEYTMMLLEIVISVAVVISVRYIVPYVKTLMENEQFAKVTEIVTVAVNAAEQTIRESGQGKAKKAQVIAFVTAYLNEKGIDITEEMLDKLIECAVRVMNNEKGKANEHS